MKDERANVNKKLDIKSQTELLVLVIENCNLDFLKEISIF